MKIINFLMLIVIITAEVLLLYGIYFIFYPFKPVTFNRNKFEVITKEVKQGEPLIYRANICKNMDIATEVTRSFNNDIIYLLPPTVSTKPTGCSITNVAVPVPEELPAGEYFLRTRFVYKINALRTITVTHDSEEFEIID
jgi:hypothetical protein